ncbi:MAG: nitroreductase family protein [Proteobacteria bacterium]|nr:nitroreductase family protein [Pseudomonadota bacterium]NLN63537.1 NAD(P)H-dependent dehydrogenase/reductase [Myxococcales bacterium]
MLEMLRQRRSIRQFETRPIPEALQAHLEEALLRAPTSRNRRPWEFIFVTDPALQQRLAACKPHSADFVAHAPLTVVIAADEATCDVWIEDCAIAAITLQYTAQTLGLGSCWVQVRLRDHDENTTAEQYIRDTLCLPPHYRVSAMVALGYPAEQKQGVAQSALTRSKIHRDRFGTPPCTKP